MISPVKISSLKRPYINCRVGHWTLLVSRLILTNCVKPLFVYLCFCRCLCVRQYKATLWRVRANTSLL